MSNKFRLDNVKDLLTRAAAKTNDSSEEKYITEYLNSILGEEQYDNEDKLRILISSCFHMSDFCDLVIEKANMDLEEGDS